MRIRQLVLVSEKRDLIVKKLCDLFKLEVAFYDPGIIHFGLENAVLPVGNTFLEVVSPVKENTTAGRYLERKKGDCGYMVIIQTKNLSDDKTRVKSNGMQIVWEADRAEEGIHAQAIHLHPKDFGAILSLDSMDPPSQWLWAGLNWQEKINTELCDFLNGVHMQSKDPEIMMKKWEGALDKKGTYKDNKFVIELNESRIVFNEASNIKGEGIEAFEMKVKNKENILKDAEELNLIREGSINIGGVKFLLN